MISGNNIKKFNLIKKMRFQISNFKFSYKHKNQGFILVYALILLVFFTVTVFGFSQVFMKEVSSTTDITSSQQAFYTAESQVEENLAVLAGSTVDSFQISMNKNQEFEIDLFGFDNVTKEVTANASNINKINFNSSDRTITVKYKYWPNKEGCLRIKEEYPENSGSFIFICRDELPTDYFTASETEGDIRTGSINISVNGEISLIPPSGLEDGGCSQGLYPEPTDVGIPVRWFPIDDVNHCNFVFIFSLDEAGLIEVNSDNGKIFPFLRRIKKQGTKRENTQAVEVIYSTAPKNPFPF